MRHTRSEIASFIFDNSLLVLGGTIPAVAWANIEQASYDAVAHPLHFWVNDVGMVFFFALAAKEVFEATLPGGPIASSRRALSPLAAAVGGMLAPALIYIALASTRGPADLTRVRDSVCGRHRVLCDDCAHHLPTSASRHSVSVAWRSRTMHSG